MPANKDIERRTIAVRRVANEVTPSHEEETPADA
jgi:hypothetical protein